MCKVIRSFMPIGQGAFYVEQFINHSAYVNLVFDCGSSTDVELVYKCINKIFFKGDTIHAVFISHLDEDHINGLEYLLTYCKVEKIFFPLLDNSAKSLILLRYLSCKSSNSENDFFYKFIDDPILYLKTKECETSVVFVRPYDPENQENNQYIDNAIGTIKSGDNVFEEILPICDDSLSWHLVPFNFRSKKRIKELINNLNDAFKQLISEESICIDEDFRLDTFWKKYSYLRKAIKEAYKRISGTLNTNSMVVFSGIKADVLQYFPRCGCKYCYQCIDCCNLKFRNGCLYTGDYDCSGEQKYNQLKNAYKSYWEYIGCVTIPHHGSRHNYNTDLINFPNAFYIISAGISNKYGHPHSDVIKDMLHKQKVLFIVNDNEYSFIRSYIYF